MRIAPLVLICTLATVAIGCGSRTTPEPAVAEPEKAVMAEAEAKALPSWTFDAAMVFPSDRTLLRAEDGVILADGRMIVSDQAVGLRHVDADGSSQPFGEMVAAGYFHEPPERSGGSNGVALEPSGTHLLVADVYHGGIYRVDIASGATELIYQHEYGVNTAVRDSTGAIWFTQSAKNTKETGEARMWAPIDKPVAEGAVYRLAMQDGELAKEAQLLIDGLFFANGIALDEANAHLYVAETVAGRVVRYDVDVQAGTVGASRPVVEGKVVDNLELDANGQLWIAAPLPCELLVLDTAEGTVHSAFAPATTEQQAIAQEFARLGEVGESRLALLTPAAWEPLPGMITGVILPPNDGPIYLSGLGNALLRLER